MELNLYLLTSYSIIEFRVELQIAMPTSPAALGERDTEFGNFNVHANVSTQYCPAVNLVSEQTRTKYKKNAKRAPVIDVSRAGYFKVSKTLSRVGSV